MGRLPSDKELRDAAWTVAHAAGTKTSLNEADAAALAVIFYSSKYKSLDDNQNWIEIEVANTDAGYDSLAMYHVRSETLVLINRGADSGFPGKDFFTGAAAAVGKLVTPLREALDFALNCQKWCNDHDRPVRKVLCCGVSWGGATTDCQAALLPPLCNLPPESVRGVGFASAGFQSAISRLAYERGVNLDAGIKDRIVHYIRGADPIRLASMTGYMGRVVTIGSIYKEFPRQTHKTGSLWRFEREFLSNHSGALYYHLFDQVPDGHCAAIDRNEMLSVIARERP